MEYNQPIDFIRKLSYRCRQCAMPQYLVIIQSAGARLEVISTHEVVARQRLVAMLWREDPAEMIVCYLILDLHGTAAVNMCMRRIQCARGSVREGAPKPSSACRHPIGVQGPARSKTKYSHWLVGVKRYTT
jgi:hypothetical protein